METYRQINDAAYEGHRGLPCIPPQIVAKSQK